ncbi:uncharacterized protein LAJ45_02963 [Morchella importuna]|uniref:uncharacterized protein n=1 Tax=Morchella importuna TaxID=1174673 RepID=UPI001E8E6FB6|nr:uncharacterized protein LAJ45_02963 [Morchella importuna]KAH8152739.1 hypothetical protein LAJ45_02963 [Morchella importuna]
MLPDAGGRPPPPTSPEGTGAFQATSQRKRFPSPNSAPPPNTSPSPTHAREGTISLRRSPYHSTRQAIQPSNTLPHVAGSHLTSIKHREQPVQYHYNARGILSTCHHTARPPPPPGLPPMSRAYLFRIAPTTPPPPHLSPLSPPIDFLPTSLRSTSTSTSSPTAEIDSCFQRMSVSWLIGSKLRWPMLLRIR